MLEVVGVDSVEQVLEHTIPDSIRSSAPLALPPPGPRRLRLTHGHPAGLQTLRPRPVRSGA